MTTLIIKLCNDCNRVVIIDYELVPGGESLFILWYN